MKFCHEYGGSTPAVAENKCGAYSPNSMEWICTLPAGHGGPHIGSYPDGPDGESVEVCAVWGDAFHCTALTERLATAASRIKELEDKQ